MKLTFVEKMISSGGKESHGNDDDEEDNKNNGHFQRQQSNKENTKKMREYNLFNKKVPKNAEAFNIQVATCSFIQEPFIAFVRLKNSHIMEDFTEIPHPTRFLTLILGPEGDGEAMKELGRAFA